jgi:hypothetical protein
VSSHLAARGIGWAAHFHLEFGPPPAAFNRPEGLAASSTVAKMRVPG